MNLKQYITMLKNDPFFMENVPAGRKFRRGLQSMRIFRRELTNASKRY